MSYSRAGALEATDSGATARKGTIMTDSVPPHPFKLDEEAQQVTRRMRAIETEFAANGLTTHLTDARAGLDLSAVLSPSGAREAEIWVDENGYVEIRYWSPPGASAAEISATALTALRAVTNAARNLEEAARQEASVGIRA